MLYLGLMLMLRRMESLQDLKALLFLEVFLLHLIKQVPPPLLLTGANLNQIFPSGCTAGQSVVKNIPVKN